MSSVPLGIGVLRVINFQGILPIPCYVNDMAEQVMCDGCGEKFDKRGLSAHQQFTCSGGDAAEAVPDGGEEDGEGGVVTVDKDDVDLPDERIDEALPAANVTEDAITFRSIHEIEVTDEEMKEELLDELKQFIRGGNLRM